MLKIFDKNHNAIGHIVKYKDCKIESELSTGDKTLYFTYLANHHNLTNEMYIRTKDDEFVIKEVPGTTGSFPQIVAVLNLEDLQKDMWQTFSVTDVTIDEAVRTVLAGTGWTIGECNVTKRRNAGMIQVSSLEVIQNLCKAFMCEPVFDTINKKVSFYVQRGEDKGVYFMSGLNLKKLQKKSTSYDYYTRIIPIGANGLTIESVNDGKNYLENYQYSNKALTYIWKDESYTDAQALKDDAELKLNDLSKPTLSYSADVRDLAKQKAEYAILSYNIGDSVTLIDRETGTRDKQRIVKLVEYPQNPEKNTCELANTVLTFEEMQQKVQDAANIINYTIAGDGRYTGTINVSDILHFEQGVAGSTTISGINSSISSMQGDLAKVKMTVGEIDANYIKADEADLKYATIENLNVTNETVHSIQGDYASFKSTVTDELAATNASITNLISRYATFEQTVTDELIAAKGWMAEGSIGSAQISSVDANKIRSGTIDTAIVTVAGSDGRLQISDNTMQISDANRVRVQVGKDASGDYTLAVWDSAGKLIWDALGATENTIQRKIIRDKMVADDAAIQALKLDLQSFNTALTNQGVTISGTVVQVGNKTLNVALTEQTQLLTEHGEKLTDHATKIEANENAIKLKVSTQEYESYKTTVNGEITSAKNRLSTAESSITAMNGQIALKVEQTDIDTAVKKVDDKFVNYSTTSQMQSAINQKADSITLSVSKTYATKEENQSALSTANTAKSAADKAQADADALKSRVTQCETSITQNTEAISLRATKTELTNAVDGIQVGGRNLILKTKEFDNVILGMSKASEKYQGLTVRGGTINVALTNVCQYNFSGFNLGDTYTLSFYAKGNISQLNTFFYGASGYVQVKIIATSPNGTSMRDNYSDGATRFTITDEWKRYWVTWQLNTTGDISIPKYILLRTDGSEVGQTVYVCGFMFEKASKPSNWTPAPEDQDAATQAVADNLASNYYNKTQTDAQIQVKSDSILSTVSTTYQTKDAMGNYSTTTQMNTAINQKADSIKSEVSATYATNEKVDGIQVGGRNLVLNSYCLNKQWGAAGGYAATTTIVADSDALCDYHIESKCTTAGSGPHYPVFTKTSDKIGKTYTWSFWAKCSVAKSGNVGHECGGYKKISLTTSWQKFTHTWKYTDGTYSSFTFYLNFSVGDILYIRDFKIEEGNKATTWTPAPEDVDSSIGDVKTIAEQTSTKIGWIVKSGTSESNMVLTDTLYSLVAENINLTGKVTFACLDSAAQSKITTAQSTADSAKTAAANAQSTADTAKTNAANAQSTANTANSTANAVKSTVDAGRSNWNSAYAWTSSNGSNMTSLLSMVKKWTNNAVSDTTTIQGGWIATNTITADKIAIGDFTNYSDLTTDTASKYGFTVVQDSSASNNPWLQLNNLQRDTSLCPNAYTNYKCNGGESFRIKFQVSSTVKGLETSSSTSTEYLNIKIGLYGRTDTGTSIWSVPTGATSDANGTVKTVNVTTSLPSSCRTFSVALQINGTKSFSGVCKVRNISVTKMSSGELIVGGAITASKIASNAVTADKISVTSLEAICAKIGGFTIGSSALYNNTTALAGAANSVYLGTDGISCGTTFKVTKAGALTATGATISGAITATSGSFTGTVNANSGTIGNITISGTNISYDSINSSYATLAKFEISKSQLSYGCMIVKGNSIQIGRDQRNVTFIDAEDTTRIYGDFMFQDFANEMRRPVSSATDTKGRVGYLQSGVASGTYYLNVKGEYGSSGSFSVHRFNATSSDIRLKENIKPTEVNALSVINQMGLYQFDWKQDGYHQKIGFVADYLEAQDERLTIGGGYLPDGTMDEKSVNDFYLMGYAIKGIQELSAITTRADARLRDVESVARNTQSEVDSLKSQVSSMQYQLEQAYMRIATLEKQLQAAG